MLVSLKNWKGVLGKFLGFRHWLCINCCCESNNTVHVYGNERGCSIQINLFQSQVAVSYDKEKGRIYNPNSKVILSEHYFVLPIFV